MHSVPPNTTLKADRRTRPAVARTTPEDQAPARTAKAGVDTVPAWAHAQSRYGNAEVARVATSGGSAVKAPSSGGHGKPSANPGAAKAAVEAKGAAQAKRAAAKKEEKKAAKKEEPKEKPGAKKDAAAGQKDQKAAKDKTDEADKDGGDGQDAGEAPAAGVIGGELAVEPLMPPQRPRLEGTAAAMLSAPLLNDQQRERVRLQTGLTVPEHYARAQVHLDRLSARATSEQLAIVLHIELIEAEVRRDLDNVAALIQPAVTSSIGRVRGACSSARGEITSAANEAMQSIEQNATDADRKVDVSALTSKDAVEKAVAASSSQVRALYEETMKPLRKLLEERAKKFAEAGTTRAGDMVKRGAAIAEAFNKVDNPPIPAAIFEKDGQAAIDEAANAGKALEEAGRLGSVDVLAQEATLGLSFLMLVNPVAVKVEHVGGADGKTVVETGGQVRLRLANDYERAKGFVKETCKRALKALDALEAAAVKQIEQIGRSLEEMARARRDQLCHGILSGQAPAADAWAQQMSTVNELVAGDNIVDSRRLEPRFVAAMDSMHALSARQRLDFDAQARSGFDEARAGMDDDRHTLEEAADSYVGSARATRAQAAGIRQVAATFASGLHRVAKPVTGLITDFRAQTEEKLGLSVMDTRKQMTELVTSTGKSLETALKEFDKKLLEHVTNLPTALEPAFKKIAEEVPIDLARRAGEAFRAMNRVGTWEQTLFEALYGMTPKYGKALEEHWNTTGHGPDLWWWFDEELSGDEYWTAYYYLKGDPVKGALFQIESSFHWYGNDVGRMESALRALTPKQLEELNKDPQFAEVKEKLQSQLKGTNLLVTNALLAGRTARADALRLKDQIDAARAAGNDDKLHDLLAQIDPKRLPEVKSEFVDVLAGNAMTDKRPVPPSEKPAIDVQNATFTTYITKPVEVYEPGMDEHDPGRWVTRTLSDPSKKLAVALATTGEGSTDSLAARLAYEKFRGGKPRPERLAKALDDPELRAARQNPIFKQPNPDPQKLAEATEVRNKLEARRAEVMQKFAELSHADDAIKKDPKRATEFTEKAVADMFGDDALGRELGSSMVRDGRANPAVAIKYAVRGWGTNEALIRQTLRGMTAEEIAELKKEYADRFGGAKKNPNALFDDLGVFQNAETAKAAGVEHATGGGFFTELSGDDRHEVEELLLGTPKNDRDRYRLSRLKYAHQRGEGTTWATDALIAASQPAPFAPGPVNEYASPGSVVGRSLDMNKARMEEMVEAAGGERQAFDEHGNFKGVPGKVTVTDFRVRTAATAEMAENYKAHIDNLVDMITGAIAIIGAIIGTIVVTVLTMGTATPLVIGLWAAGIAAATGAAVMATKFALKGSRYGWEEAAVDGAVTLVDAATAGLMAGAGAKAARAATQLAAVKATARTVSQEAVAEGLLKQHARKELARGFVRAAQGAGVSGASRTAMTDGTWDEGVLTGLGRTVRGGAESAAVGLATHGAGQGFSRSGIGQKLGQSTSYLGRGFGSGIGGALGGMAGRSTELTLGVLGGRDQGPWDEALLSIVAAGGRGFAENVGQGMAEVPKARRDAAQARLDQMRKMSEVERAARFGANAEDAIGDARFRRMAVAAALAHDPRTNTKAFLEDLDAAVAQDRSLADAHRRLVREFRREALASIPADRRGEFANVPIHIVPDAEFERFTGSQSGRAVTIFVDGEAQIIVRKSADPEVLREEGIHVLQSRDPKWRDRIARLDEATMSRWHELDLETQLSLYRDKLDVEIDAQLRLRKDLMDEADRAPDAAKRAALLARVEESDQTLTALHGRRAEVEAIGPDRIAAMLSREEARPQYLREPARLFMKGKAKPKPPPRDLTVPELHPETAERIGPILNHGDDLSKQPRRPVDLRNSTWEDEHAGHRLYQVGDAWTEVEDYITKSGTRAQRDRYYRMVEVTEMVNGVETVVDRRREILQITDKPRWQQRGSEATAWGTMFEEASRQYTLERIKGELETQRQAAGEVPTRPFAFRPDEDSLVPIGALRRIGDPSDTRLSAQHSGGAGFDDVYFRFRTENGELVADIIIVEAKGHRRSLTLDDFSAIAHNFETNLEVLGRAINASNLSDQRKAAIQAAIDRGRIAFEVHRGPKTGIGDITVKTATILNDVVRTQAAHRQLRLMVDHLLQLLDQPISDAMRTQIGDDVARLVKLHTRLTAAYTAEPFKPQKVRVVLKAILEGTRDVESVSSIAKRYNLDVDKAARASITRDTVLDRDNPAHAVYFEQARVQLQKAKRDFERSAGFALALAEEQQWATSTFVPVKTASTQPADVVVTRSSQGAPRALAVTRPSATGMTAGAESVASRQLVKLLSEGVVLEDGHVVHPDPIVWDTAGASPAQIAQVLEQIRAALLSKSIDPARLRVMIDGGAASNTDELQTMLSLGDGVRVVPVTRAPHHVPTWLLEFEPSWVAAAAQGQQ
jgi:hypothetical protein